MTTSVLINLPQKTHQELKARAARAGMSLHNYLVQVLNISVNLKKGRENRPVGIEKGKK